MHVTSWSYNYATRQYEGYGVEDGVVKMVVTPAPVNDTPQLEFDFDDEETVEWDRLRKLEPPNT